MVTKMVDLRAHSVEVILNNQAPTGAFLATPHMPDYHYCWFRDSSFVAYALDLEGHLAPAHHFHDWAAQVIGSKGDVVQHAEKLAASGEPIDNAATLHTRYTVNGEAGTQEWSNFQLDGFGTWLWAVEEHLHAHGENLPAAWRQGVELTGRYLAALWRRPNYDLWEEHGTHRHPYTQATIYAGLMAASRLLGRSEWATTAAEVQKELLASAREPGHFTKFLDVEPPGEPPSGNQLATQTGDVPEVQINAVDGSLLGLALPHGAVALDDPALVATVACIESDLRLGGGGVHRYVWDTYYGGGEWLLLTAWLGWYHAAAGQQEKAQKLLALVEASAEPDGDMSEQTADHLIAPIMYQQWVDVRGPIASPLLWSHAQYLILRHALGK
jgi:GH15 family glucan-1,4-alpha-glucosidase